MAKKENARLIVLQLMQGKKEELLGGFSTTITKKTKEEGWEAVRLEAIASGANSLNDKEWKYVRDTIWSGARRDAVAKRDKARKSGESSVQYNEADQLVFEILGPESAVIQGLGVKDSEETNQDVVTVDSDEEEEGIDEKEIKKLSKAAGGSNSSNFKQDLKAFSKTPPASRPLSRASKVIALGRGDSNCIVIL